MLTKRIIPCLDVKDGRVVKGTQFKDLRDAGDPVELARKYNKALADELVFLDISATTEERGTIIDVLKDVAKEVFIPLTVGGGIQSLEDVGKALAAGADKVGINSAAVVNPGLITQVAKKYGNQCVVVAIDVQRVDGKWLVFTRAGTHNTGIEAISWAQEVVRLGAGEILLTSIDTDGGKQGFDLSLTQAVAQAVSVPVIASGGAGTIDDFVELFSQTQASAGLAASIFHYDAISIKDIKDTLRDRGVPVRHE